MKKAEGFIETNDLAMAEQTLLEAYSYEQWRELLGS